VRWLVKFFPDSHKLNHRILAAFFVCNGEQNQCECGIGCGKISYTDFSSHSNAPEGHRLKLTLLKAGILSRLFNCYYWKVAAFFFNKGGKISVRASVGVGNLPTLIFLRSQTHSKRIHFRMRFFIRLNAK
jgi:hypothetical protein